MFKVSRANLSGLMLSAVSIFFSAHAFAYDRINVTEVSLVIQSNDLELKFPNTVDRTKASTVEVTWWQYFSASLEGRLSIAYVELSQNTNSSVMAYDTSGYELGIGFRGNIFESEIVNLGFGLNFDYLATSGETTAKEATEISWYKYSGSIDAVFLPLNTISILTGVSYTTIDGEHKVINTTNSLASFTEDQPEGYYVGISFKSGGNAKVNVTWHGGYRQGVYLVFSNHF